MKRILIIEDEELAALRLKKMLLEIDNQVEIVGMLESVSETIKWLQNNPLPDLIFLDIQLADGISFEIFNSVSVDCPVIFITAYDNYALKAFELNSIDYLLKPLRKELLNKSIEKFKKRVNVSSNEDMMQKINSMIEFYSKGGSRYKERFVVYKGESLVTVYTEDISYFYIEDKAVFMVLKTGEKHLINISLDQLESTLNPVSFFRINRQYIVSIKSIEKASNYFNYRIKLKLNPPPPTEVMVSTSKTAEFKLWLDGML
jgi:DNA-binding LytR/AlgR family response regulator